MPLPAPVTSASRLEPVSDIMAPPVKNPKYEMPNPKQIPMTEIAMAEL
jgi:hypothetical protein